MSWLSPFVLSESVSVQSVHRLDHTVPCSLYSVSSANAVQTFEDNTVLYATGTLMHLGCLFAELIRSPTTHQLHL